VAAMLQKETFVWHCKEQLEDLIENPPNCLT